MKWYLECIHVDIVNVVAVLMLIEMIINHLIMIGLLGMVCVFSLLINWASAKKEMDNSSELA